MIYYNDFVSNDYRLTEIGKRASPVIINVITNNLQ